MESCELELGRSMMNDSTFEMEIWIGSGQESLR